MIFQNGGLALDISQVKAIKKEYLNTGRNLVFELNNYVSTIINPETGEMELKSFPNDPVVEYFETSESADAYFDEWVEIWEDYRKSKEQ